MRFLTPFMLGIAVSGAFAAVVEIASTPPLPSKRCPWKISGSNFFNSYRG